MSVSKTAFIFPAFVRDYQDDKSTRIENFNHHFHHLLDIAARIVDPELTYFDPLQQNFLDHELRTQYIAYIYGCAISEILQQKNVYPDYLCGYSMGIYAALNQGGAISFTDGLLLIRSAFQEISYTTMTSRFGMAGIIGLTKKDIHELLTPFPDVEISNQNSPYSFVLSGRQNELESVLKHASEEGAFHARMLNVTVPYHSHFLKSAALQFAKFVYTLDIRSLKRPVISILTQETLQSSEDIKAELVENLYKHFNWYDTQLKLMDIGIKRFIECSPGNSLKKNARTIEGDYQFESLDEILSR